MFSMFACSRLGTELINSDPKQAHVLLNRACSLGSELDCALDMALSKGSDVAGRVEAYCATHAIACENAATRLHDLFVEHTPQPAKQWLLQSAVRHGRLLALLRTHEATQDAFALLPLLREPCRNDIEQCKRTLGFRLSDEESLAIRLALCEAGVGTACRFVSFRFDTIQPSKKQNLEALTRGCNAGDSPCCALLGATFTLDAEENAPESKQAEQLLKSACSNKNFPCHTLTAPGDGDWERIPNQQVISDRRYPVLRQAACTVAHDQRACREIEEPDTSPVSLPWSESEADEGACQGGLLSACRSLLMAGHRKVPEAACRSDIGGACEALLYSSENARQQLSIARKACGLGRCNPCQLLWDEPSQRPYLKELESSCRAGCAMSCRNLDSLYNGGGVGVPVNPDKGAEFGELGRRFW
jgi:TPR repeat protein